MAKKSGLGNQFYFGGYDLSGDVGAINSISSPRGVVEVASINQSAQDRLLTHSDGLIEFNSFFNDASNQEHAALKGLSTSDQHAMFLMGGSVGDVGAGLVGKQINYDGARTADGGLTFSASVQGNATPVEWGVSLTTGKATTGAASFATVDQSASSSSGAQAYVQAFSIGSGTATAKVEDSTNGSSWDDLITFTNITGRTAERATVAGTVNRYVRCTVTGSISSLVLAVLFRRGDAADI